MPSRLLHPSLAAGIPVQEGNRSSALRDDDSQPACVLCWSRAGTGVALRNSSGSKTRFQTLAASCQLNP